ncbi:MAG: Xaa-Pro peptidase family protein [Spirochaetaceae bacterium]|jgi:Xaa-Pro dipeptidase|nr:Xaa-Pro peptidase family protein [Spirochaetaceae bacterium]
MEQSCYTARLERVRAGMKTRGIDVFILGPSSNLRYLTGYTMPGDERPLFLVLPSEGPAFILANLLYRSQVEVLPVEDRLFWTDGEDPFAVLQEAVARRGLPLGRAALEPHLPAAFSLPLGLSFPRTQFVLGDALTAELRQYKDPAELELIRYASREADRILGAVMERGSSWLGHREAELAEVIHALFREAGLEPWDAIVAAGENGASPHHASGSTPIQAGKGLIVDFGGRYQGYTTDCTRTFFFGSPSPEFEELHRIVLEAHLAAEEAARPGNTLGDVDAAARGTIEKYGYGDYFTHRTGHGIGLDTHEGASASRGETTPLKAGMVFSIEPGIYLPGRFGVRIENLVAITETGREVLHRFPRELQVYG